MNYDSCAGLRINYFGFKPGVYMADTVFACCVFDKTLNTHSASLQLCGQERIGGETRRRGTYHQLT